jgi:hypothetical protein
MSECLTRDLTNSTPEGDLRSTAIDALCLVRRSEVGGGSLAELKQCVRFGMERSIRKTEAPLSARSRPANGPLDMLEVI